LLIGALLRVLVGPPANDRRAVAEASAGDLIVTNLDYELGLQRLPLRGAFCVPAARTTWGVAGEARRIDQLLEILGQLRPLLGGNRRRKADMIEPAFIVVEAEQERPHNLLRFGVTETPDDAVRSSLLLHLDHRPFARTI